MRFVNLLIGIVIFALAAWFLYPAAFEGWKLLTLPLESPKQLGLELALGSFSLRSWAFVLTFGPIGLFLGFFGFYVLVSAKAES